MNGEPTDSPMARLFGAMSLALLIFVFWRFCFFLAMGHYASGEPLIDRQDLASINQAIWNTANGDLLRASILYDGVRDHLELILFPYALIRRLGGGYEHVIQLHLLLVGLGAIPVYMLGRARELAVPESLLFSAIYLLQPPMHALLWMQYLRPDLLFFPVMATLAYALLCDRKKVLIAAVVMTLFCKESGAFMLFGLGGYLWWVGRERAIAGLCLVLGVVWLPLFHVLIVLVNGQVSTTANLPELVELPRLRKHLRLIWPVVLVAVVAILLRRGRGPVLVTLPHLVVLALYRVNIRYLAAPFSFVVVLALDAIARWRRAWPRRGLLVLIAATFIAANQLKGVWHLNVPSEAILQASPLMQLVPDGASLATERPLLLQLSERRYIYHFNRRSYLWPRGSDYTDAEYYLLRRSGTDRVKPVRRDKLHELALVDLDSWGLETVAVSGPWTLYRRPGDIEAESAGVE